MIDYCFLSCLFSNEISTYKFYGDFFEIHSRVGALMEQKHMKESDDPEFVFINQESYMFFDYYWKNELTSNVKWLFVMLKESDLALKTFKEVRHFSEDAIYIDGVKPIIVLKNIKPNFKEFYRHNMVSPANELNLDSFFNFKIIKQNLNCKAIKERMVDWPLADSESRESSLTQVLSCNSDYVYYGNLISETDIDRCKMFANMKFNLIECVSKDAPDVTLGWFCKKDCVKDIIIYLVYPYKSIKSLLRFNEQKLTMPATRI